MNASPTPSSSSSKQESSSSAAPDLPGAVKDALRMLGILALLSVLFGLFTDSFLSVRTFQSVAHQVPALMVAGVGMTFVLVIGRIDLSVGSVLALCSAVLGVAMVGLNLPLMVALPLTLLAGAVVGAINGLVAVRWRLPSFIVTLGMLEAARGATYLLTDSRTQYIGEGIEVLDEVGLPGLSLPFLVALAIVVVGQIVLSRTVFGRHLIATGTNEEAVRLAGIDTRKLEVAAFVLCGVLVAVAAVMHTARLAAADPNAGVGFELQAIAAAVIGGTSLMGGRGTVVGTLFGVLIIAVLDSGLAQVGAQEPVKRLITGVVIVSAVILDNLRQRRGVKG